MWGKGSITKVVLAVSSGMVGVASVVVWEVTGETVSGWFPAASAALMTASFLPWDRWLR